MRLLLAVIAASFLLMIGLGFSLRSSFMERGNSHTALNRIALNLESQSEYSVEQGIPSIDYEPLYPALMAASYWIFGFNWFGLTLFQALMHAGTAYIIFLIGKRLSGVRVGLIASVYYSFYPYLFFYSLSVGDTTLFVFLMATLVFLLIRLSKQSNWVEYLALGLVFALAILTRASVWALLPPMVLYLLIKVYRFHHYRELGVTFAAAALLVAPWLTRNYQHTGELVISTHGAFGLWQGNNRYTQDYIRNDLSLDEIYRRSPPPEIVARYPLVARPPKEAIEVANAYREEATRFIVHHPRVFVELMWIKFAKMWTWIRNPSSSVPVYGGNVLRQGVYFVSYFPLLLGLLVGGAILLRRMPLEGLFVIGMMCSYTVAHMIVMGFTRARLPLDPLLMILFGIACSRLFAMSPNLFNNKKLLGRLRPE